MSMAKKKVSSLRCPTCRGLVLAGNEDFPFCSERCRLIDLGKWASEGYRISTPITDPEMLESLLEEKQHSQSQSEDEHDSGKH